MNNSFKNLAFTIVEKAVNDYKLLKKLGVTRIVTEHEGTISKSEIEDLFHSGWCDYLLQNMKLTGEDILIYLNRE